MQISKESLFHLALTRNQSARYAILPGDPGRVERIASLLDAPTFVAQNREFTTWCGTLEGERVLVTSTGIGGPSAAIAVEELAQIGVHTFIRVGTCGGMQTQVQAGELVIPTGAIRAEGTSQEYIPLAFPAVPSFTVLQALVNAAKKMQVGYHTGVVHCKDSFYGQHAPQSMPSAPWLENNWQAWIRAGALASEMETAALFTVGATRGLRTGAVLLALWNQERERQGLPNPHVSDTTPAIQAAVAAMRQLILDDKCSGK